MHKSRAARSQAKDKLLCASSPCLSFCPLNPECDGKSAVTPVSANQTDASEEAEFEADEEAEPVSRKGHAHFTASRRSQHRRGRATDAQARLTESSQLREDRERKKLHDVTDTLAERTEERRASKEIEERKKLTDLTEELCAEDPCQVGCPPNAACALVVNSGIDGEVQFEAEEDAAAADAASSALTAATISSTAAAHVFQHIRVLSPRKLAAADVSLRLASAAWVANSIHAFIAIFSGLFLSDATDRPNAASRFCLPSTTSAHVLNARY